ncbi:hypothetical protein SCMU_30070 [Sinomonas cyclohexanicum]|uniref:Uncharacterized protein n=1 Tax=Sinomonas cyclohexanicum TaxID=322009 RepID=A0ABM7PXZ8_SINCY|nr:hypothetical protein [Corynebacterium cyclohexanicum]BCT77165.1 hypothetical protein SCMU_30070 [Corynebacterium cyclohexanicum]
MNWLIVIVLITIVVAGYFWIRKNFKNEIERYRRIRRSNRGE